MKSLLVVMLLAAAATAASIDSEIPEVVVTYEDINDTDVADVTTTAVASRNNINVGVIGNSRLLSRTHHVRSGIPGHRHIQDITFRANNGLRFTAIRVTHYGNYQGASAGIRSGGVGSTVVTIRLQSRVHFGYQYRIELYGR
ncbi:uncharacterized protein LOC110381634 [Helicoverpa armigera]|uniref:uncharacterized protein LOC110381634 n=1 Tax=Helicoverpa armigera TaxID=29058 RepID=UPI003082A376